MFHRAGESYGNCTSGLLPGADFYMSNIHNTMVIAFTFMDAVWSKSCDGKWCQTWSISGQHVLFLSEIPVLTSLNSTTFSGNICSWPYESCSTCKPKGKEIKQDPMISLHQYESHADRVHLRNDRVHFASKRYYDNDSKAILSNVISSW